MYEGFEPKRDWYNTKAQALISYAAHGSAGSAETGVEGADRMSATGTPNPSLSVRLKDCQLMYN